MEQERHRRFSSVVELAVEECSRAGRGLLHASVQLVLMAAMWRI